ncbi:hypothetical protein K435DRAFT_805073 [Dendrothele bispora CBS 962.96]|uniref:Uncharacterized protein n=1 Tax=Dendrothele bispora (strain CBS 962.96) TaxID=1314807 RepID=A0A4S8LDN7_DENBC|nr:hypothetical protein K435DRAFT_805073 [Dendrothele bispora CBS 962.96]
MDSRFRISGIIGTRLSETPLSYLFHIGFYQYQPLSATILGIPKLHGEIGEFPYTVGNSQVVWRNWGIPSMLLGIPKLCELGNSVLLGIPKLCGELGNSQQHTGNSRVVWRNWGIPNNILGIPKFCEAFWEFPVHDREFPLTSVSQSYKKVPGTNGNWMKKGSRQKCDRPVMFSAYLSDLLRPKAPVDDKQADRELGDEDDASSTGDNENWHVLLITVTADQGLQFRDI